MSKKSTTAEKLAALVAGQVLLVKAIKTSVPGKVQLEFAEVINTRGVDGAPNPVALLNQDDPAFGVRPRRHWQTGTITAISKEMGLNLGDDAEWETNPETGKEEVDLGIMNPTMSGLPCRIRIVESLRGTEWQEANTEKAAKRRGKDGDFITHKGCYIFNNTQLTLIPAGQAVDHQLLEADAPTVTGIKAEAPIRSEVGM